MYNEILELIDKMRIEKFMIKLGGIFYMSELLIKKLIKSTLVPKMLFC